MRIRRFGVLLGLLAAVACAAVRIAPFPPEVVTVGSVGMVPLDPLAELLGADVARDARGEVTVALGAHRFVCAANRATAHQDGKAITLPLAPFSLHGALYVPLRPLVTALGGALAVNLPARTAMVTAPGVPPLTLAFGTAVAQPRALADDDEELYVFITDDRTLRRLSYDHVSAKDFPMPAISPDGRQLAFTLGGMLYLRPVDSMQATPLQRDHFDCRLRYTNSVFSPDGRDLLCELHDLDQPGESFITVVHTGDDRMLLLQRGATPCYGPDGGSILYSVFDDEEGVVAVYEMNSDGSDARKVSDGASPRISPDGSRIIIQHRYFPPDGARDGVDPVEDMPETDAAFSPDSQYLVLIKLKKGIFLRKFGEDTDRQLTDNPQDAQPFFAPDGKMIYFLRDSDLYRMPADGGKQERLTTGIAVNAFLLTPDGQQVLLIATPRRPSS